MFENTLSNTSTFFDWIRYVVFFIGLCFFSIRAKAESHLLQMDTIVAKDTSSLHRFRAGFQFFSDEEKHGKIQSTRIPYLTSSIEYTAPSGFYATFSTDYLLSDNLNDNVTLGLGYEDSLSDNNVLGGQFNKFIYNKNSPSARSGTSAAISLYDNEDVGFLQAGVNLNWDIFSSATAKYTSGHRTDFLMTTTLGHEIDLDSLGAKNFSLTINPSMNIDIGTQYSYLYYYEKPLHRKRGMGSLPPIIAADSSFSAGKTTLTGFHFDFPIELSIKRFSVVLEGMYFKPRNAPAFVSSDGVFIFSLDTFLTF